MRISEWVLAAYFAYVTVLSLILPVQPGVPVRTIIVNGLLLCSYAVLLRFPDSIAVEHLRNWIPLALMLLLVLPSGAPAQIAMHAILLVAGAAIVLAMRPDDEDPQ